MSVARAKTSSLTFSLYSFFTFQLLSLSHLISLFPPSLSLSQTQLHCFSFSLQKSFTPQKNSAPFWQGMYTLFTFLYTFTIFTSSTLLFFFYYFFFTEIFLHAQLCKDLSLFCVCLVWQVIVFGTQSLHLFYIFFFLYFLFLANIFGKIWWNWKITNQSVHICFLIV